MHAVYEVWRLKLRAMLGYGGQKMTRIELPDLETFRTHVDKEREGVEWQHSAV